MILIVINITILKCIFPPLTPTNNVKSTISARQEDGTHVQTPERNQSTSIPA